MTVLLIIVLLLAVWLAFPSPRAAGQRTRRALQGVGTRKFRRRRAAAIRPCGEPSGDSAVCAVGDPRVPGPSQ